MLEKHLLQFFKICGTLVKRELFSFLKKPELYLQRLLVRQDKLDNQIDEFVNVHAHLLR